MQSIIGHSVLDQFFDESTMSVHFKEKTTILKKKGGPGNRKAVKEDKIVTKQELELLIEKIFSELQTRDDAFLEIDKAMSKIIQVGPYRIVIVYPPLSDGLEITVVKPVKKLSLEDYEISEELMTILRNKSQGVLISGSPGSGKSTFAQALAQMYISMDKIVKTIESPRDLQVSEEVVQYSFTYGSYSEIRDILLLSRPDFTLYDEVRNTEDFGLYKDLRLTGIGLVGVIHSTQAVDSIQRFLGNIEMGIIPQVVDTVIFIEGGKIKEVLTLELVAKIPTGMMSADLARPVIQISSLITKKITHEIYSFGEQIVVMPIDKIQTATNNKQGGIHALAEKSVKDYFSKILNCDFLIKMDDQHTIKIYLPDSAKGQIIGKNGQRVMETEKKLGMSISVKDFSELPQKDIHYTISVDKKGKTMSIQLPKNLAYQTINAIVDDQIFYWQTDENAIIHLHQKNLINKVNQYGIMFIE